MRKHTIEVFHEIAEDRRGKCLSKKYINTLNPLNFICEYGHKFESIGKIVLRGGWCSTCRGRNKTIDDLRLIAKKRGGFCLSKTYKKGLNKYKWKCAKGHQWKATAKSIIRGSWCHMCNGGVLKSIKFLRQLAKQKQGKCLSKSYIKIDSHYEWKCSKGHQWKATGNDIQQGKWCPYCSGFYRKKEYLDDLAAANKGKCVSKRFIKMITKYTWECQKHHQWKATANKIQQGGWCPRCKNSKGEKKIENVLNSLGIKFEREKRFKNCRYVLPLPFDFYLPTSNILIEFDGEQHFVSKNNRSWDTDERLKLTKLRDSIKNSFAKKNSLKLVRIPYTKINEIETIIKNII